MTHDPRPGPYRAQIEGELRRRLATARTVDASARAGEASAPEGGPLALRCTSCGHLSGYRVPACQRCATTFNAEIVWLPAPVAAREEVPR